LAQYRYPKNKTSAEAGAFALIEFLKNALEPVPTCNDRITVKDWMEKFTHIEGNPRGARNMAENRPYSVNTIKRYECLYRLYLKDDPSESSTWQRWRKRTLSSLLAEWLNPE
jgi:hypothetical protein